MALTTTTNTIKNTDPNRLRDAVLQRFSPLDGIGKDLQGITDYLQALAVSELGFTPVQKDLFVNGLIPTEEYTQAKGYKAIYNDTKLLSVVTKDYTVVSNEEAFQIADDLVRLEKFRYVTASIEKDGARCRLVLEGPAVTVQGEIFTPYAILNNSFDLSRSVSVQFMFLRNASLSAIYRKCPGAHSSIALAHFGNKTTKLNRLAQFRTAFAKALDYIQREADALAATPLSKEEFRNEILPEIIAHVFQRDKDAQITPRQAGRTQAFIESVLSAYDAADTSKFNGTAYKVLLTMTDLDSHLAPFINRSNPNVYINRVLQTDTIKSLANHITDYIIRTRKITF